MRTSEQINEIAAALAKAQAVIEGAKKDSTNPHFRSKYADLAAVWDACREPLTANGLAVVQPVCYQPHGTDEALRITTVTRLTHSSGQWMEDDGIPLLLSKQDMQGLGSALTYSRRYGLMSMVGIAPEDDDGNGATQKPAKPSVEVIAEPPTKPIAVPEGAVLIKKVEQLETAAHKVYFQMVFEGGETLMTWSEPIGKAAEQYCQNHEPVRVQVNGTFRDMPVIKAMLPTKVPAVATSTRELASSDIPF